MKVNARETGRSRAGLLLYTSFAPGSASRKKIATMVDKALSETIDEYVKAGGVIRLPLTFKSVLKSRIIRMIDEKVLYTFPYSGLPNHSRLNTSAGGPVCYNPDCKCNFVDHWQVIQGKDDLEPVYMICPIHDKKKPIKGGVGREVITNKKGRGC